MDFRRRLAQLDLVATLLAVVLVELVLNRLAVPVLRPPGNQLPPGWHQSLDRFGLFVFYLASVLAVGTMAWKTWEVLVSRPLLRGLTRVVALGVSAALLALATTGVVHHATARLTVQLESALASLIVLVALGLATRPADYRAKVGLLFLMAPFLVHFYGTAAMRYSMHDGARWASIPDRVRELGNWSLAACAIASPFCFGPRPWISAIARPGLMAIAAFVGTIGAVVLRKHYEVGMEIASRGLGIDLGPGAPMSTVALNIVALVAITWTLAATLTSRSVARRQIGLGLALIVGAGYAFAWPLSLLAAATAVLTIADASTRVGDEEREGTAGSAFHLPPIPEQAWEQYLSTLASALHAQQEKVEEESLLRGDWNLVPYLVRIKRHAQSVRSIEVTVGESALGSAEPAWVLSARPDGILAIGSHPPPPEIHAPVVHTGDVAFDRRFRIKDAGGHTQRILDEGQRARATAVLDGWLALWPEKCLRYSVFPGRGAPLDHPIPLTELAFHHEVDPSMTDKLVSVLGLLCEIAERGDVARKPSPTSPDDVPV
ncbi:MAG: hypothetical protein HY698_20055 [Deltaproteobacteria bacterium]|nr:hypothetical protein [Deltaproteobacteria bacterium]